VAIQLRGGTSVADTSLVRLEPGGAVLVRLRPDEETAERGDVAELRTWLDRIERKLDALARTGGSA
jgi:site-specific recombinase